MFDLWPYTNLHALNLDWMLKQLLDMEAIVKQCKAESGQIDDKIASGIAEYTNSKEFDDLVASKIARETYVLNVKSFGAVGDGVADDTAAFQAALDAAAKLDSPGIVFIPFGKYNCSSLTFGYHRGVMIIGERSEYNTSRCTTINYIGQDYLLTLAPTDYPYMYGCRICNINVIFQNSCAGGFNIKNLEESVIDNVAVMSYNNPNVISAFNINGLTISTLRNIRTNGTKYAFNLIDTSTGENPRTFGGCVNITECNFFEHDAVFNCGKDVNDVNVYNNWAESFNAFIRVQSGVGTLFYAKIYKNTLLNNEAAYAATVLDMANTVASIYDIDFSENVLSSSQGRTIPFRTAGETFIQGRICNNQIKGYAAPFFDEQPRLYNVAIQGNRTGAYTDVSCKADLPMTAADGSSIAGNGANVVGSGTIPLSTNKNSRYCFIIAGNDWSGDLLVNGAVLKSFTNIAGCVGGKVETDGSGNTVISIGESSVTKIGEARILLAINNPVNAPILAAFKQ